MTLNVCGRVTALYEYCDQYGRKVLSLYGVMVSSQDGLPALGDMVLEGGVTAIESLLDITH